MSGALKGVLILVGISHVILIVVPVLETFHSSISKKSKLAWCAFLILLPYVGAAFFHFRFRASMFQENSHATKRAIIEAEKQKHSPYNDN